MHNGVYLGFDFGYKRIGMAVGQLLTKSASPLPTLHATLGVPQWHVIQKEVKNWSPLGFVVGLPTKMDGGEQYTAAASREFAHKLHDNFALPVYLVDERLTTVAARDYLFTSGGYGKLKKSAIDSIAACIILEQWLQDTHHEAFIGY